MSSILLNIFGSAWPKWKKDAKQCYARATTKNSIFKFNRKGQSAIGKSRFCICARAIMLLSARLLLRAGVDGAILASTCNLIESVFMLIAVVRKTKAGWPGEAARRTERQTVSATKEKEKRSSSSSPKLVRRRISGETWREKCLCSWDRHKETLLVVTVAVRESTVFSCGGARTRAQPREERGSRKGCRCCNQKDPDTIVNWQ